jgi:hypothetical protein
MGYFAERRRKNEKRKKLERTISALDGFIQQVYWGEDLTPDQSEESLQQGLVEISYIWGDHAANGILITDDGYFLTARHCLDKLSDKKVRLYDQTCHMIDEMCAFSKLEDIALAKADIPGECKPKSYRFYNTGEMESDLREGGKMPVAAVARWNNQLKRNFGFVEMVANPCKTRMKDGTKTRFPNQFMVSAKSRPGYSGGLVTCYGGRFMGIISGGFEDRSRTTAVKLFKALELVDFYKRRLQARLDKL